MSNFLFHLKDRGLSCISIVELNIHSAYTDSYRYDYSGYNIVFYFPPNAVNVNWEFQAIL